MKIHRKMICRGVIVAAVLVYAGTLAIAVIGSMGLFGTTPDAMASVFLIFVGMPWSLVVTKIALFGLPIITAQVLAALLPIVNIMILHRVCNKPKV